MTHAAILLTLILQCKPDISKITWNHSVLSQVIAQAYESSTMRKKPAKTHDGMLTNVMYLANVRKQKKEG